jgi:hypothetical protein
VGRCAAMRLAPHSFNVRGMKMKMPSVVHPKRFLIKGMYFEVVSYSPLNEEQAAKVAMMFFRGRKFKKSDKGKLFQVITQFDAQSAGLL